MNALVICPDHREAAGFARRMRPLALLPFLGRTLLDIWMEHLAGKGVKHVTILAADRPDQIRQSVEQGGRWGLTLAVISVQAEPTIEAARAQFMTGDAATWHPAVITLETLPQWPDKPLWETTESLFELIMTKISTVALESRLTMHKIAPNVFVSTRARIAPTVKIEGPAWIGAQVIVADHAHILPGSIIEDAAYIDRHACVRGSWIGPKTYVGAMTEVSHSFVWGNGIENWRTSSFLEITDDFLIASLKRQPFSSARSSWFARLFALTLMIITAPLAMLCMVWSRLVRRRAAFVSRQVVLPPPSRQDRYTPSTQLHALNGVSGLFSRWPELWRVWRGDMQLVGNRPLCPTRAVMLGDEFEQLWLRTPAGVFSLSDAADDNLNDQEAALAHAACYTMRRSFRMNIGILQRCLPRFLSLRPAQESNVPANNTVQPQTCH